jgi:hypothetical protein
VSAVDPVELVQWREAIDAVMPFSTFPTLGQLEQFLSWLFGDALSWANIVQVPARLLTGAVAWVFITRCEHGSPHGLIAIPSVTTAIGSCSIGRLRPSDWCR